VDRLERLVNLVAALIDTPRLLTRDDIRQRIEGYSDDPEAFRRNFERDKELLRQMGLPLVVAPLDPNHPDEIGYRIPREEYELPDPGLDEHELAALRLASAAVQVDSDWGRDATVRALRKLGGAINANTGLAATGATLGGTGLAALQGGDAVATAFGAISERRRLRFTYRGAERRVDPWRLSYRRGQWYLAAWDHGRGEERLFRLDRVEGPLVVEGDADAFSKPPDGEAAPPPPWRLGEDDEITAELLVDPEQARWATEALGEETVAARHPDGSLTFRVGVTNVPAFRSFVLGFLDHAQILGPPGLRHDMITWLSQFTPGGTRG
jgi:predicted DNA-binding transcriptional regulator YafY